MLKSMGTGALDERGVTKPMSPGSPAAPRALLVFGIDPIRIGGIELQTRAIVERLGSRGWECVLCFHNVPREPVLDYLSLPNVIWDKLPNAWSSTGQTVRDMARLLRTYRPRILHLQFTPALSPYPWLGRLYGVDRIFFTDHGSRPEGYISSRASLPKLLVGKTLNAPVTKVVGVSDYNRRTTIERGYIPAAKVTRIYNGTDLTLNRHQGQGAAFRQSYGIPLDRTLVVQVCWIIPDKGVGDLLDAARIALSGNPRLHFAFVGEGPQRQHFMEKSRQLGISDHVTWTGLVEEPHARGVYAAADIACQVSRWEEALGMVITEAMVYAKPLVGTRVGGIPEMVRDGETGFLVERGDTAAMAARILELSYHPELRQRLGRAGRALVEAEFNVRTTSAQWMEIYGLK
jgi:glycosyltransferase involved in cell wall biosynthesis